MARRTGRRSECGAGAADRPRLPDITLAAVLKRMGRREVTAHGFRSTFRDWAGETTAHPREVIEAALAHRLQDKAEAAYARGDLFAKRRKLMETVVVGSRLSATIWAFSSSVQRRRPTPVISSRPARRRRGGAGQGPGDDG